MGSEGFSPASQGRFFLCAVGIIMALAVATGCGISHRCGSDQAWLRRRPAAAAPIRPLAWEPPQAGVALKRKNIMAIVIIARVSCKAGVSEQALTLHQALLENECAAFTAFTIMTTQEGALLPLYCYSFLLSLLID